MNVLVTGVSGFIGSHFVKRLASTGHNVFALTGNEKLDKQTSTSIIPLSGYSYDDVKSSIENFDGGVDYIVNFAAYGLSRHDQDPHQFYCSNIGFTQALLEYAANYRVKGFVSIGSVSEYENKDNDIPLSEVDETTTHLYGASKSAIANWGRAFARSAGFSFVHLRLFNVYGKGESENRLIPYLNRILRNGDTANLTDGEQIRDFVHIDDVSECIMRFLHQFEERQLNEIVNVCTSAGTKVKDLVLHVVREFGLSESLINFGAIERRADEIMWAIGDNNKLNRILGWTPEITIKNGIKSLAEYYESKSTN